MKPTIKFTREASHPNRLVLLFSHQLKSALALPGGDTTKTALALAKSRPFTGGEGETLLLPSGAEQWLFLGLGGLKPLTRTGFSRSLAKGFAELRRAGVDRLSIVPPKELPWSSADTAQTATEALNMSAYSFDNYRTQEKKAPACQVEWVDSAGAAGAASGIKAGEAVFQGVALARDLINHPAAVAHTDYMVSEARRIAKLAGAKIKVIRDAELIRQGYEALHAVGRSADHPPALVAMEYGKPAKGRPTLALVGKGVVFDSGGLNLKGTANMALMKKDMGGAAIVMGAFRAITALKLPIHLVAVVGLAENSVGPNAYRPGDVLKSKAGLTIEITNTDAEGRVVLADAFALAHQYKPTHMVDFATLTGACRVALGKDLMGLFSDHEPLRELLLQAGQETGENVWPLPLWQPYRALLDSGVADMTNSASGGLAGAITAALFLKEFAGTVAWAHLDCYGWSDGENPLYPKGGSGAGVRLSVEVARKLTKAPISKKTGSSAATSKRAASGTAVPSTRSGAETKKRENKGGKKK